MNDTRERKRPNLGLLLLIPAAVIIAKGASRRRAQWRSAWDGGSFGPRHGPHGSFGDSPIEGAAIGVPPYIQRMLDTWHAKAHEQDQPAESTSV